MKEARKMNFNDKKYQVIGLIVWTMFLGVVAAVYFDVPTRIQESSNSEGKFVCPMHPEEISNEPGNCSICGMVMLSSDVFDSKHGSCGANGEHHPGCCSDKSATNEVLKELPVGHPPIDGWMVKGQGGIIPVSTNTVSGANQ